MDPFCELSVNGVHLHKTAALDGAGKRPIWDEELDYKVTNMSANLLYKVLDEDVTTNDLVGEGTISISDFCEESGRFSYPLTYSGNSAGTIRFETSYVNFKASKENLKPIYGPLKKINFTDWKKECM